LKPLCLPALGTGHRFRVCQSRKRLVALGGQENTFEIAAESLALCVVERYIERCLERLGEDGPEESVGANMHMAK
jgi:hypothetical protein